MQGGDIKATGFVACSASYKREYDTFAAEADYCDVRGFL